MYDEGTSWCSENLRRPCVHPGHAPRSSWLSGVRVLTSQHGRGTRTDPTMWCFSRDGLGTTYALVAAYVDEFITGVLGQDVDKLKYALRGRCRWKAGKTQSFVLRGKKITLSCSTNFHTRILESVSLQWTQNRDLGPPLPAGEVTRDRGVWCASLWKVSQTDHCMQLR